MKQVFEKSLLLRMGLAMATITALAFMGMLSSVIIAETTQGAAAAINQAGSLRMQSYRIASSLARRQDIDSQEATRITRALMDEFEERILSPRLTSMIPRNESKESRQVYDKILSHWKRTIRPVLFAYINTVSHDQTDLHGRESYYALQLELAHQALKQRYLAIVDGFVADIDHMVHLLEVEAESNIQLLRLIQVSSLFLTVGVVFVTMYLMHAHVLVPLRGLLACAEAARRGDFSVRTEPISEDELGHLGHAFNVMAADLSKMYADLEARVQQKTADLERSNRSLELLYNTTRWLNEAPLSDTTYAQLLGKIENLIGVGPGTICLSGYDKNHAIKLATTRAPCPDKPDLCQPTNCPACFDDGRTHVVEITRPAQAALRVLSIPITDQEQQYGVLLMELPQGSALQDWQSRLLEAVADHIGMAINIAQRATQSRRLALLEERSVIARELHDSLAQSLSYMKIQVSRLGAALPRTDSEAAAHAILQELRDGINSAYRELRELLTTFRLRMDGRGLSSALEETVHELRERSTLTVMLHNHLPITQLTPNEEIHVLQVVREALSNVVRHAQASRAEVTLDYAASGEVVVTVDDDGIGIPDEAERRHHYGLAIMNERAHSLHGRISATRRPGGGSRIQLIFAPIHRTMPQSITQNGGA
ncbi:MAG: type IV pili methyl-accepting chemotaxis transducer N-terminal domain-containing protein [Pseudomonadota bacterium]